MNETLRTYARTAHGVTPQTQRADSRQVVNNAGGYVFKTDDLNRLRRFLVLGTDKGTFYVKAQNLTKQNVDFVIDLIRANEAAVREEAVEISTNARAKSNSQALFVMALLLTHGADKAATVEAVQKVARTATHLFEFAEYVEALGGWGRAKKRAVSEWYTSKDDKDLAYQVVKYRQRNGWKHRDLFRLAHPKGVAKSIGEFVLHGKVTPMAHGHIQGFAAAQQAKTVKDFKGVAERFSSLPWEAYPTALHTEGEFWTTLFYNGALGQTALLRNVTRFAKLGLFEDLTFAGDVAKRLADKEEVKRGRMHPMNYLNALFVYEMGRGFKVVQDGCWSMNKREFDNTYWKVNPKIAGALEKGYHAAFGNVESSGKRTLIALDVSGSMSQPVAGLGGLDARDAAAAMAQVTVRSEDYVDVVAFTSSRTGWNRSFGITEMDISETDSLQSVINKMSSLSYGGTDIALPIMHALENGLKIDTFVVYTDNETWDGPIHVHEALKKYRKATGIQAKLVSVALTATEYSVADPDDPLTLDVVGFDASAPRFISEFSAGNL